MGPSPCARAATGRGLAVPTCWAPRHGVDRDRSAGRPLAWLRRTSAGKPGPQEDGASTPRRLRIATARSSAAWRASAARSRRLRPGPAAFAASAPQDRRRTSIMKRSRERPRAFACTSMSSRSSPGIVTVEGTAPFNPIFEQKSAFRGEKSPNFRPWRSRLRKTWQGAWAPDHSLDPATRTHAARRDMTKFVG